MLCASVLKTIEEVMWAGVGLLVELPASRILETRIALT